ncbi:MAG: hypothetical protein EZS28_006375 [Streblomastix strix]|uniref:Uncharacterized protein n=1 Tax=Streblomastix strix TaxID=222440 RepID=A0A5J4WT24_9EUKA|nr:MAG: hypothetical protein EZS28_006375 [Streblomastix strix]
MGSGDGEFKLARDLGDIQSRTTAERINCKTIILVVRKLIEERAQGIMIVPRWPGQVWWTSLNEITVREKKLGESERVLECGLMMRNLKVRPGRILALEANGDKMEQDYFKMH